MIPAKEEIKKARLAAGLTQLQSAQMLGKTPSAWAKWEYGENPMDEASWSQFLLLTDQHPEFRLIKRGTQIKKVIKPEFKRYLNEGTKELLDLLVYDGEWWQLGKPDESRICEAWVYGNNKRTMLLKEIWEGVGEPIDGEYDQLELVGYEIQ